MAAIAMAANEQQEASRCVRMTRKFQRLLEEQRVKKTNTSELSPFWVRSGPRLPRRRKKENKRLRGTAGVGSARWTCAARWFYWLENGAPAVKTSITSSHPKNEHGRKLASPPSLFENRFASSRDATARGSGCTPFALAGGRT